MFWNHRPPPHPLPPALHGSTEGQALLGLLTLQPLFLAQLSGKPSSPSGSHGQSGFASPVLELGEGGGAWKCLVPRGAPCPWSQLSPVPMAGFNLQAQLWHSLLVGMERPRWPSLPFSSFSSFES